MPLAARAVYFELLMQQLIEGSLPDDPAKCARLIGEERSDVEAAWPHIRSRFEDLPDNRMLNRRMDSVRTDMAEQSRIQSERGSRGGRAKAQARNRVNQPILTRVVAQAESGYSQTLAQAEPGHSASVAVVKPESSQGEGDRDRDGDGEREYVSPEANASGELTFVAQFSAKGKKRRLVICSCETGSSLALEGAAEDVLPSFLVTFANSKTEQAQRKVAPKWLAFLREARGKSFSWPEIWAGCARTHADSEHAPLQAFGSSWSNIRAAQGDRKPGGLPNGKHFEAERVDRDFSEAFG